MIMQIMIYIINMRFLLMLRVVLKTIEINSDAFEYIRIICSTR